MPTKIEWTDEVWNVVTGCTKISDGCKNCYAEGMIKRFGHGGHKAHRSSPDKRFGNVTMHPERMAKPYSWKKPRTVFVCSMGDLFHESIPFKFIDQVHQVMYECERHNFLILTKRPQRVLEFYKEWYEARYCAGFSSSNMWFGVSVEDQKIADERIPILLQIPAARRFVSVEPMLSWIDLHPQWMDKARYFETGTIDWVIAGCESGPKRRPAKIDWFRSLRDQCVTANVPFFLKQVGGNPYVNEKPTVIKMPKIDGQAWNQRPAD